MIDPCGRREAAILSAAHALGVRVLLASLPGSMRGAYMDDDGVIVLREGLSPAQRVSALAHETVHARRGDVGPQTVVVEARVDEDAAVLAVTPREYREAERVVGPDPRALAVELDVTPWLVSAWQRRASRSPAILVG